MTYTTGVDPGRRGSYMVYPRRETLGRDPSEGPCTDHVEVDWVSPGRDTVVEVTGTSSR